eukprot:CAMPEP_0183759734 /NCGR_PEP_ID=MMETSP0739-20130205/7277_1 /TAXON_ID=385413 /ORGANISM="Thalassiosira miniscula, Strain CCMP1093" /LENGTH=484 /DNA_ID=CAMNT_0025997567 /DNA_START=228 /DNA_END=1682 /DNA_ORIENTATION=+
MSKSWKAIDDFARSVFEQLAEEGRKVYQKRVAEYQETLQQHSPKKKTKGNGATAKKPKEGKKRGRKSKAQKAAEEAAQASLESKAEVKSASDNTDSPRQSAFDLFYIYKKEKLIRGQEANVPSNQLIIAMPGLEDYPSIANAMSPEHVRELRHKEIRSALDRLNTDEAKAKGHSRCNSSLDEMVRASWKFIDDFGKTVFEDLANGLREMRGTTNVSREIHGTSAAGYYEPVKGPISAPMANPTRGPMAGPTEGPMPALKQGPIMNGQIMNGQIMIGQTMAPVEGSAKTPKEAESMKMRPDLTTSQAADARMATSMTPPILHDRDHGPISPDIFNYQAPEDTCPKRPLPSLGSILSSSDCLPKESDNRKRKSDTKPSSESAAEAADEFKPIPPDIFEFPDHASIEGNNSTASSITPDFFDQAEEAAVAEVESFVRKRSAEELASSMRSDSGSISPPPDKDPSQDSDVSVDDFMKLIETLNENIGA